MGEKESFFARLSDLMSDEGLNAESLAQKAEIDPSGIRRYLRKEILPTLKNAIKLAEYFHCRLNYLFGLDDDCGRFDEKSADFAESFEKALREKNVTRYRLCKDTRISPQSADDWFNAKRKPSMENVLKIAEYLDCSVDYLVGRE